jgi:AAA+ ATPase superfamily predicted ATPase
MFLGRLHELDVLGELAASPRPELFVLYGRRRVGKTELLQQFCRSRRAVYFLAAQVREKDNLRAFRDALAEGLNDPLAANVEFPDWGAALAFAAERARDERLVLVLDEFPYLCEATKGLPSIVQRFWDTRAKTSKLMLVLCGSQVSFMEEEVLAETSPLFGRRTGQRRLEPLAPSESLRFFASWPLDERVLAYSILGGMPAYLRRFDPARSLRENVLREVLRPEGYLYDEVNFLLRAELTSPATYNSILAAVARGAEKLGDVALTVGVDSPTANKYLTTLRDLQLAAGRIAWPTGSWRSTSDTCSPTPRCSSRVAARPCGSARSSPTCRVSRRTRWSTARSSTCARALRTSWATRSSRPRGTPGRW